MSDETPAKASNGLIISVALNGLLIGLLAAALLWGGPKHRGGPPAGGQGGPSGEAGMGRAVISAAPQEDRARLRRMMRQAWTASRTDREIIRETRARIAEITASGEFDEASLNAEFAKLRAADTRVKEAVQSALAKALAALPPESRAKLGKSIEEQETRRGERRERFRERLRERRN